MSLQPQAIEPVPELTARVARAAFPNGNAYLRIRDELGSIYRDSQFRALFSPLGQPAEQPWRLALVLVMQYAEELSDKQAAIAVRGRIDWKYALGLELTDPGFDASVLSEFRTRLLEGHAERQLFDRLLDCCKTAGLVKARGRVRTDSTHVLAATRALSRLETVGETMRHALGVLAEVAPEWLRPHLDPAWLEHYGPRVDECRFPKGVAEREALASVIGADGVRLLAAVTADDAPAWLREVPALVTLRTVWDQQFAPPDRAGVVRWRAVDALLPAGQMINSPYDPQARYCTKRQTVWTGYKVQLTETCDAERPHLITDVQTTVATMRDDAVLPTIQQALAERDLVPAQHLVDAGYVNADVLVTSQQRHQVDLVGPPPQDTHWQARAGQGFDAASFTIDWAHERATCPRGAHCTTSKTGPREITVRPRAQHQALLAARQREQTPAFRATYAARAGIEGTMSQALRRTGLRRARYLGLAKTHLQHLLTAAALNLCRLAAWFDGPPRRSIRITPLMSYGDRRHMTPIPRGIRQRYQRFAPPDWD